jgi:hypothetical protein
MTDRQREAVCATAARINKSMINYKTQASTASREM